MHHIKSSSFYIFIYVLLQQFSDHMASLRWLAEMSTVQRQEAEALILLDLNSSQ